MDAASGGGTQEQGTLRAFHQLYASSSYLGEGQFLSLSNLLMLTPGFTVSPAPHLKVSMEYGHARRQQEDDNVYAGGMRVYQGTENVQGVRIGNLLRVHTNWALTENIKLILNYENLSRGEVLRRARLPSGSYVQVGVTYRY
ncbi:MAG TPA: alginate export family protein [Oligoflexus sp.]|uniref:alginate export family protein n=1 Tax=Oligoflexus sp. TaxID=1971216 RepID=UPI002D7FBF58|nr:alginate export family protein [Oligoflexus sp.]HET9236537.1 alginate export family protein [Oligoflexus sp.]